VAPEITAVLTSPMALKAATSGTVRRNFYQHFSKLDYCYAIAKRGNKVHNEATVKDTKLQSFSGSDSEIPPPVGSEVELQLDKYYTIFFSTKKARFYIL